MFYAWKYAHQIHSYNTRHRDLMRLPLAKTAKYQGSFRLKVHLTRKNVFSLKVIP